MQDSWIPGVFGKNSRYDMKLSVINLLVLVLISACGKTEAQRQKDDVDTYMAGLLDGKYESQLEMKLFDPAQIPSLLSYADDDREVNPPANPLSSFLSVSSLGMYALWMIEGIRVAEVDSEKTKVFMGYPSLNPAAVSIMEQRPTRPPKERRPMPTAPGGIPASFQTSRPGTRWTEAACRGKSPLPERRI